MRSSISPFVRNLVVCEEIATDTCNAKWFSLLNLVHSIRSLEEPCYPLLFRQLCVYVQLTGCRGAGEVKIEIREADTDERTFVTRTRSVPFPDNPLSLHALRFRILDCRFPRPGLYWIQFWYNNAVLSQQPVLLR